MKTEQIKNTTETMSLWSTNLVEMKNLHLSMVPLLANKKIAYLDIPLHYNFGDILIYLGTEKFLEQNNLNVIYRCFQKHINYKSIDSCDTILLHGGGNFGDLYEKHQKLREKIVKKYKEKQIIILPQTIFFSSKEKMMASAKVFKKHKNIVFYVRDKKSYEIATLFTDKVHMMPDMAHSLHPLVLESELNSINNTTLNLRRKDKEGNPTISQINKPTFDWSDLINQEDKKILKKVKTLNRLFQSKKGIEIWEKHSNNILFTMSDFLCKYGVVYSDRLHGMIFSILMGKKVYLSDNNYGKNKAYYQAWLKFNPLIKTNE